MDTEIGVCRKLNWKKNVSLPGNSCQTLSMRRSGHRSGARSLSCVPCLPVHLWHDLYDVTDLFVFLFLQLVSNAIQFLASVAERPAYRSLFEDPTTLANICEKVIVPNIQLRGRLLHYLAVVKGQQAKTGLSMREGERERRRWQVLFVMYYRKMNLS